MSFFSDLILREARARAGAELEYLLRRSHPDTIRDVPPSASDRYMEFPIDRGARDAPNKAVFLAIKMPVEVRD
jgi:hypothetical protein